MKTKTTLLIALLTLSMSACGQDQMSNPLAPVTVNPSSTVPTNITGTWDFSHTVGYNSGLPAGSEFTGIMELVQTSSSITGSWYNSGDGNGGTIQGSISGDAVTLTVMVADFLADNVGNPEPISVSDVEIATSGSTLYIDATVAASKMELNGSFTNSESTVPLNGTFEATRRR